MPDGIRWSGGMVDSSQHSDSAAGGEGVSWRLEADGTRSVSEELLREMQTYLLFVAGHQVDPQHQAKLGASDLVQQSMAVAVEQLTDFRGSTVAEFRGWLRQILINQARLARRGYAAEKRDVRRETGLAGNDSRAVVPELADGQLTPATHALAGEDAERIRRLIDQLPEDYQSVIRLRNWEDLSFEAIAVRMNLSTSGAAKTWYRALVEIQKLYRQQDESRAH